MVSNTTLVLYLIDLQTIYWYLSLYDWLFSYVRMIVRKDMSGEFQSFVGVY